MAFFGPERPDCELTHRLRWGEHPQRQKVHEIQRFAFRDCHDQICACGNERGKQAVRKRYKRVAIHFCPGQKAFNQSGNWPVFDDAMPQRGELRARQ